MGHRLFPLLLIASGTVVLAQAPENSTPDPLIRGGDLDSSAGTLGTNSQGPAAPREIVTPSLPSPPGGAVTLAAVEARFAHLDQNHNGWLSMAEMNAIPASPASSSSGIRFNMMDTNHDGQISAAEFAAAQPKAPPASSADLQSLSSTSATGDVTAPAPPSP